MSQQLLTVKQLAEQLQISPSLVYQKLRRKIRPVRVEGALRFRQSDVDAYVNAQIEPEPKRKHKPMMVKLTDIRIP